MDGVLIKIELALKNHPEHLDLSGLNLVEIPELIENLAKVTNGSENFMWVHQQFKHIYK